MVLGLNWVDFLIIGLLLLFAWEAWGRSLLWELIDLASFIFAGVLSFSYYNIPARLYENRFSIPHGLSLVLGFMSVWFLTEFLSLILVRLLLPKIPKLSLPGLQVLLVIPAFLRFLIFIAVVLVIIATFPFQPSIKTSVLESKLGSQILKYAYGLEQPIKQVFGGVANDTLTFLTIKPKTNERVDLGFKTDKVSLDTQAESIMLDLVNKERASRGIKALVFDSQLQAIARAHSGDMFKRGYFSHYSPEGLTVVDRAKQAGIYFLVIGENLAYAPTVEIAHQGLMNSQGHRANILSEDYGRVGIGVIDGRVYGKMFTQVFTN